MNNDLKNRISTILAPAISEALALIFEEQRQHQAESAVENVRPVSQGDSRDYLTVAEAAKLLRVNSRTIYELVYQDQIPRFTRLRSRSRML